MLAGNGMCETEHVGMQAKTAHGILIAAILAVADDRVAKLGHVDTNLVLAAGLELTFNKRIAVRRR